MLVQGTPVKLHSLTSQKMTHCNRILSAAVKVYITLFSLSVAGNVLVKVECKAWAHNIRHDRRDQLGVTQFQLLID
jgi:hypothetical protein